MAKKTSNTIIKAPFNFTEKWEALLDNEAFVKVFLSDVLEDYIIKQRWYGGKASKLKYIELAEYFRIQQHGEVYYGLILEVNFEEAFFCSLSSAKLCQQKSIDISDFSFKRFL